MAGPGDCRNRHCRPPGIGHLVPCQGTHDSGRTDRANGPSRSVGRFTKTNCACLKDHPSRKRTTIHYFTDLFAHKWVSEKVVLRYWSARQARPTAGCRRHSGSRSATAAIAQQPEHCKSKSHACRDYQESLRGLAEEERCVSTG